MDNLRLLDRKHWRRPQFDVLHDFRPMGEIRFDGDGKTYRLFGYFGPERLQFTLVAGYEKKRDLDHEIGLAYKRMEFAERHIELLYDFEFQV